MRRLRGTLLLVALLLGLAGCLPPALEDATPDAAVIGVPANARLPGAAEALHARLTELPTGHDLVPAAGLRFLEVRSGLLGSRVARGAARVARNSGAEVAVTVGAHRLERVVHGPASAPLEEAVLQLEVVLVRAADAQELARLRGPRLVGRHRLEDDELPALSDDRLVRELARRGVAELARRVADELEALSLSGSSGG